MVQIVLNLAYISEGFVNELEFGPGISTRLKGINIGAKAIGTLLNRNLLTGRGQ